MPPADVQRLLSLLANDEALRERLHTDPDAVLRDHDLTPDEARMVIDLNTLGLTPTSLVEMGSS